LSFVEQFVILYNLRLTLYREGQHTVAKLIHSSGKCIVSASTKESAISQQLPRWSLQYF